MSIKINKLEIENVKRVRAVKIEPQEDGLTVIGGRNNQGKTSVLDSIAWALGGDRYRPSAAQREGSVIPPRLHVVMSNGLIVERSGKNSDLKVIDPDGNKSGQTLLNEFVEQLAIDLPKFLHSTSKEKAQTLLQIIGVGERLAELEQQEAELYNQRHAIGQIADQKKKYADEMTSYPDAPKELVSASELIKQQQAILARNGENLRKRENLSKLEAEYAAVCEEISRLLKRRDELADDVETARKSALDLLDESTEELERNIADVEAINIKVRANQDKDRAAADAITYGNQYNELTVEIEAVRQAKIDLLAGADLPLEGLSVEDGELTYNGMRWDNMSGSDQLKVATAIVRKLNPKCGFVLLDRLEQMDIQTLADFGDWLRAEGLQAIATRVSTGDECSLIIEDGYIAQPETKKWEEGKF